MHIAWIIVATMLPLASAFASETPTLWKQPRLWQFYIEDTERKSLGAIVLEFTETPVEACTKGDWQLAKLVSSSATFFKLRGPSRELTKGEIAVAYLIDGAELWVDLNANLCDEHYLLGGELSDTGASGRVEHRNFFLGTTELGRFKALPARRP